MDRFHCLLRIVLVGIFIAAAPAITTPQERNGSDKSEPVSAKVRREASELALRFRRAKDDLALREKIADQSIQLGKPFAEKVLVTAVSDKTKSLKSYGTDFSKQIKKADRISAAGVISSSKKLQQERARLIQLDKIETRLRAFVEPNAIQAEDDAEQTAETDFEKNLRTEEERAVEQWLVNQGYRSLTADESAVIASINRLRREAGLQPLEIDYKLCFAARDHSNDMVQKQFFSHKSKVRGKKTYAQRARRVGTIAFAENIAHCNHGESPVTLWLNSKPHKRIMYGRGFNTIGVGRVGKKYTAMFGRKIPAKGKNADKKND